VDSDKEQNVRNIYEDYIHKSRYARYRQHDKRRETWAETCERYMAFLYTRSGRSLGLSERQRLEQSIYSKEVMPSMRCLMTAGPALDRDNVAGYNCAYVAVDHPRVFDEILYILMCGTGVGFSVERQYINKLPEVAEEFHNVETVIKVPDSKIGWASSYRQVVSLLYSGQIPHVDTSNLRPRGAVLHTFGGRSSGPEPLEELVAFTTNVFKNASGRKLNSLECHDLICKVASVVVCGGVRRSALISLSNLTDERMRNAKHGDFFIHNSQRALANNSTAYTEKPDTGIFLEEWRNLYTSKAGERGIFSRQSAVTSAPSRRETDYEFGTNPCSEIILRSKQFCNLSEVIIRPEDTLNDLKTKVEQATILGTLQSTLTNFRYLRQGWKNNTEEERLLGVSLTGIYDHKVLGNYQHPHLKSWLTQLKEKAIETNEIWADKLGIPRSAAITCVKPSGTVSQLCSVSSGIHPRYAPYYIRRVRATTDDPLCSALIQAGIPHELDKRQGSNEYVFSFPISSPDGATCVKDRSAIEQLELWKIYNEYYCEHKPSVSIYVKEQEWLEVGAWVYENFSILSGVSFFPYDDHIYTQAPYEEIDYKKYKKLIGTFPDSVDLNVDESQDYTTASQELACTGGSCEL
jgi:ribonucleoside-triphosphate reductase